jgi:hypothetical protein
MNSTVIEIIGYLAPVALVISFFFKNMVKLRCINTVGCILFIIYGCFIQAYPVVVANAIITLTNLYYLLFSRKK